MKGISKNIMAPLNGAGWIPSPPAAGVQVVRSVNALDVAKLGARLFQGSHVGAFLGDVKEM